MKNDLAGTERDGSRSVVCSEHAVDVMRRRDAQQALARLRHESRWYLLRVFHSILFIMLGFVSFFLALVTANPNGPNEGFLLCSLVCLPVGGVLIPNWDNKSLAVLAEAPDTTMIAPLLDVLEAAPEHKARKIRALLTLLLPQINASDAALLNRRQRRVLYDALLLGDADRESDYLLAVLQAVAQIGNTEVVSCLRQIVQRGAITLGQLRLFEAASEGLRAVEARQAHQHIRDSLLRASAGEEPSDELLRAAQPALETAPQTLLRPEL